MILLSLIIVLNTSISLSSPLPVAAADSSGCFEEIVDEDSTIEDCTVQDASLSATIPRLHKVEATCTAPTVAKRNQCILDSDLTLTETLDLASNTRLNCQGHKLTPADAGSPTVRSNPEVAVLLNNVQAVKIQNCEIEGFDFGIVVVNSKIPEGLRNDPKALASLRNKILSNTIASRSVSVQIIKSDNNEVSNNNITFAAGSGRGIVVYSDSDLNQVSSNKITGIPTPPEPFVIFPGALPLPARTVGVITSALSFIPLVNVRLGSTLVQIAWDANQTKPDKNLIEGNEISMMDQSGSSLGIVLGDLDKGTIVRENTIFHSAVGIAGTSSSPGERIVAGTCSLDPDRRSLSDSDCYVPGVDTESKGFSTGVTRLPFSETRSKNNLIEKNGLFFQGRDGIQISLNYNSTVRGNTIAGSHGSAVLLTDKGLETTVVLRNFIYGNGYGLMLIQTPESQFFGAKVSLNDITGSTTRAIGTNTGYAIPAELSASGRGNYWGHSCSEGGFLPDDTPDSNHVKDSHPYGTPIAGTSDNQLPPTCT